MGRFAVWRAPTAEREGKRKEGKRLRRGEKEKTEAPLLLVP